jgi:LacI family transcriptional regulator
MSTNRQLTNETLHPIINEAFHLVAIDLLEWIPIMGTSSVVTLKDVAERAQVSIGTASQVLTHKPTVTEENRQRVLRAVEELGYQPNLIAKSLVTGRSQTIDIVAFNFENSAVMKMVGGIDRECRRHGYSSRLSSITLNENALEHLRVLSHRRGEGIVWAMPEIGNSHEWINSIKRPGSVPIVFTLAAPRDNTHVISIDNRMGARLATEHLIEHGYQRIGHIVGHPDYWDGKERKEAWEQTLLQAGLDASRCLDGNWQADGGDRAMREMLARWPDTQAVFCGSDLTALGALHALREMGCRVPEDIALIGFDDVDPIDYYQPPLTSIHVDFNLIGELAVRELFEIIASPDRQSGFQAVPTRLVVRESCGCHS